MAQVTVAAATTASAASRIAPVTANGMPWMNVVAMAVPPAAMSAPSPSKSNPA
jgi:hypothetical protein